MEWDGYNGGEIASKLATETVRKYIENNIHPYFIKCKHKIMHINA